MSTSALAWMGDIADKFGKLFPKMAQIYATHRGVLFRRGDYKELGPGIHWYWPVWSIIVQHPVVRQSADLAPQDLMTSDGRPVHVNATVVYQITDICAALVYTHDYDDTISDVCQSAVAHVVTSTPLKELCDFYSESGEWLRFQLSEDLEPYGVQVLDAFFSDLVWEIPIRNMGDG